MKASVAKQYGCKRARHCGLMANGRCQVYRDFCWAICDLAGEKGMAKNASAIQRLSNAFKRILNAFEFFSYPFSSGRSHELLLVRCAATTTNRALRSRGRGRTWGQVSQSIMVTSAWGIVVWLQTEERENVPWPPPRRWGPKTLRRRSLPREEEKTSAEKKRLSTSSARRPNLHFILFFATQSRIENISFKYNEAELRTRKGVTSTLSNPVQRSGRLTQGDMLQGQIPSCERSIFMKNLVAGSKFCPRDMSPEFKSVWIEGTCRGDKTTLHPG